MGLTEPQRATAMSTLSQWRRDLRTVSLCEPGCRLEKSDVAVTGMPVRTGTPDSRGAAALRLYRMPTGFRESELLIEPVRTRRS